jgi:hypothetical protein
MTSQFRARASQVAAIAVFVMSLATSACATSSGAALAPAEGVRAQRDDAGVTTTSGVGAQYITAHDRYGVASDMVAGGPSRTGDTAVCTESGSLCLEP